MTENNLHEEKDIKEKIRDLLVQSAMEVLPSQKALGLLCKIPGDKTVNITCRPTGIEDTLSFLRNVEDGETERLCPHVAARRIRDRQHLYEIGSLLQEKNIKRVFVVGGDGQPFGEFKSCMDVLEGFSEMGLKFDEIGVGGYPEGNPVFDMNEDEVLAMKQSWAEENGTKMFIVTQICFEPGMVLNWVEHLRNEGIYLPVRVGVLGKINFDSFNKVLGSLGITDIVAFLKSKTELAKSMALKSFGGYDPEDFIRELAEKQRQEHNLYGVNVFTLGNISASAEVVKKMG